MAKDIKMEWAAPDDPIYTTGCVIGGKRFGNLMSDSPGDTEAPDPRVQEKRKQASGTSANVYRDGTMIIHKPEMPFSPIGFALGMCGFFLWALS